jgi:hypothetical protein
MLQDFRFCVYFIIRDIEFKEKNHCLIICPKYNNLKKKYLKHIIDFRKYVTLMNNYIVDCSRLSEISNAYKRGFKIRKKIVQFNNVLTKYIMYSSTMF